MNAKTELPSTGVDFKYSTVPLPDGVVIGGQWPKAIISWPDGKGRGATKPEWDLFQALEKACEEIEAIRETPPSILSDVLHLRTEIDCRIDHGASGPGHLEYVRNCLDQIMDAHRSPK